MFVMFLMVLQQMPLFLNLMLLMTLMPLQWGYWWGRRRNDFSKFEKIKPKAARKQLSLAAFLKKNETTRWINCMCLASNFTFLNLSFEGW